MGKTQHSAGIAIICQGKMLLCHSTSAKWFGSFMPPKGSIEEGESEAEAACRETLEEVGIDIKPEMLGEKHTIKYLRGISLYKEVYIFEYRIESLDKIGLGGEIIPEEMLQLEEIDEAKFMDKEEASVRILPRYKELLKLIS
jgi:8-oxo-dGTP pyrophosphatase MutT (NUDIX family)